MSSKKSKQNPVQKQDSFVASYESIRFTSKEAEEIYNSRIPDDMKERLANEKFFSYSESSKMVKPKKR